MCVGPPALLCPYLLGCLFTWGVEIGGISHSHSTVKEYTGPPASCPIEASLWKPPGSLLRSHPSPFISLLVQGHVLPVCESGQAFFPTRRWGGCSAQVLGAHSLQPHPISSSLSLAPSPLSLPHTYPAHKLWARMSSAAATCHLCSEPLKCACPSGMDCMCKHNCFKHREWKHRDVKYFDNFDLYWLHVEMITF